MDVREALSVISKEDLEILYALEKYSNRYEFVPLEVLEKSTRLPLHVLERSLYKLNSLKIIKRQSASFLGYRLTIVAYDVLAIVSLMKKGYLDKLGEKLGVGKESDVYLGITPSGKEVAVKFHRVGRTSFRHVARHRSYKLESSWLLQSKVSAQREFAALRELSSVGAKVPEPIARSRHVVVTELIKGAVELSEKPPLKDPLKAFQDVIETIDKAYNEVGIVHGDLSEYNVIVNPETSEAYVIDWPQYVERDHPRAKELLRRDVDYVVKFFRKTYSIPVETEEVYEAIVKR
ncbi:serine/threonine kinase [Ignicoccus islandicus DSM 13165]|uniref:non-specific serine/threonine protein kinase n=1 Tax=Ignicoccus islandicus DSM 13165 TaxID=940295 RepID=A0A0U3F7B7_9CREN|nr:RIO1 family regulatory kinase/ATPase [Ignicoccus islandicus]ALU11529.1 serine/threonine kinase [Ignicoccus islandicus DSM 13165]